MSFEFFITALVVVLIPGTGVIYTISTGLFRGPAYSVSAAFGCTLGIVPHILASIFGLAALLHTSAVAFQAVKYAGVIYLLYMAYDMWKKTGALQVNEQGNEKSNGHIKNALNAALINILNPKLSIFFLAFLPQFTDIKAPNATVHMVELGGFFMLLTLGVFLVYGLFASWMRTHIINSPHLARRLQQGFGATFALLGLRLAFEER